MSVLRDEVMRVDAVLDEGKPLTSAQLDGLKAHLDMAERQAPEASQVDLGYLKAVRAKLKTAEPSDKPKAKHEHAHSHGHAHKHDHEKPSKAE